MGWRSGISSPIQKGVANSVVKILKLESGALQTRACMAESCRPMPNRNHKALIPAAMRSHAGV